MKHEYKIIARYGYVAKSEIPHGLLNRYACTHELAQYFDECGVLETSNKWEAIKLFAEKFHTANINTNAYDFQDGVDCVAVEFFQLCQFGDDLLTDVLLESDFPTVKITPPGGQMS